MTDSSTSGYLAPAASPAPAEGQDLNRILQPWIVGVTGMDPTLVRPAFQSEPPDIPGEGTAWCAFRYASRPSDTFPYIRHDPSGYDEVQRQETIELLASFYDLGTSGLADFWAAKFRDGIQVSQNLEAIGLLGIKFCYSGDELAVPVMFKSRWQYRVDLPVTLRRQVNRQYSVLSILSMVGTLVDDLGNTRNIGVKP